jgi:predicted nucleotidyltransferase
VTKTSGVVAVLRDALASVVGRAAVAAVFGSVAKGTMTAASDVDLLVVSPDLAFRDLAPALRDAGRAIGREVNPNLYRQPEWAKRVADRHSLATSILREPRLAVIGVPNDLERLAEEWLAEAPPAGPG